MRSSNEMRPLALETGVQLHADGSCLIRLGDTHVLCSASLEEKVPAWMKGQGRGWITSEYGMLPRSTHTRTEREAARGRSLRSLELLISAAPQLDFFHAFFVLSPEKGGFQKGFKVRFSLERIRQPLAESDGVCVVVLPSQSGVLGGSHQGTTDVGMAIGRHAHTDPRPADQDQAFPRVLSSRCPVREIRIIHRGGPIGAKVDRLVPLRQGPRLQALLEVKTCMIASKTKLHRVAPGKRVAE